MEERFVLWHLDSRSAFDRNKTKRHESTDLSSSISSLVVMYCNFVSLSRNRASFKYHNLGIVAVSTFMAPLYPSADGCFQQGNMPLSSNHPKLVLKWSAQLSSLSPIENPLDVVEQEIYITDVLLTNRRNCETLPCQYGPDHKEFKQFLKWKRVPPSTMKVASEYIISMLKNF